MLKKSLFKKALCTSLIAVQCLIVIPYTHALASTNFASEIYKIPDDNHSIKLFGYEDNEDLKAKIIQDSKFIDNWASIAHSLGFGWCGGTASQSIGEDFEFRREEEEGGKVSYTLTARYNSNDPYAEGYRANERLCMKISNVRFVVEPNSIKLGKPKITKLTPLDSQSFEVINPNKTDAKLSGGFNYITTKTTSKTENFRFGEKIGVKTSFKIGIPSIVDSKVETSFEVSADQGWSNTNSNVETKQASTTYMSTVAPQSKKRIFLDVLATQSDVPYEGKIYMEYDIEFFGFLRYTGNARKDHTEDRPYVSFKFGGKNGMSAVEHLKDLYKHRNINGYSQWDWKWVDDNVKGIFQPSYEDLTTNHNGGVISGVFTSVNGTRASIREGNAVALPEHKRSKRSTKDSDVRIENVQTKSTAEFKVNGIICNDKTIDVTGTK
ncbi:aerolysin family beta-barrel pore-forming toxin [Clostridium botulinum]|uniref:Alpha-toxin n=1 Tax=Clostridium botulinum TaxID=1491 RepID=A0A9Q1UYQ4_CLOBO|nr:aerolysin family beta-barrel pore-forming toxin [Clostridium botulinum]AEB77455.1 alpha-toxin [Clostridium botulinum BKT015925]KEH96048.1 alpha-toxin [Clostridium botulinum C/D str. Sp77]KEH96965.1 alpha-toxin [Clostridium botulinum D str. 16868]KLU74622.1 alpha-toxin [Clostridium botulinum V891]KOA74150.1 alpha-toxin [Clostridium botulinum]